MRDFAIWRGRKVWTHGSHEVRVCKADDWKKMQKPPGRNEPCLCGSGRKFKKCCGRRIFSNADEYVDACDTRKKTLKDEVL